jgi:Fe-S cluster assembly protein SufD
MSKTTQIIAPILFPSIFETRISTGNQALNAMRKAAWADFEKLGIPTPKNEEYKFTNLHKPLNKEPFELANTTFKAVIPDFIQQFEGIKLLFINGELQTSQSDLEALKATGIEVSTISNTFETKAEWIGKYFNQNTPNKTDGFAALNTALFTDGLVFHLPRKKVIATPIYLINYTISGESASISFPRFLTVAEENTEAQFIEIQLSSGNHQAFCNQVSEIHLEQNSNISWNKLDLGNENLNSVIHTQVYQAAKGVYKHNNISLSGGIIRNNLNMVLDTEHAEGNMFGLYLLEGKTQVDNHTSVDHRKANGLSNEHYKGIVADKSTGVFNGKIFVRPNAQKTNAYQSNGNILLSDDANIHTKPQLEIWADDVKCSHGCTIGQLDEEALFYLRSRGLSAKEATALLLFAFASEVIEKIDLPDLRAWLETTLTKRLEK